MSGCSGNILVALVALSGLSHCLADAPPRPNVLLLLVDDLKPALGCYGDSVAQTPHIDALAARGLRFEMAYCNQAVCAPSRFNLMLGAHSTSSGLYNLGNQLREQIPDAVTLPQHFAQHGYRTESLGKVFHIGHGNQGDPQSFSVAHFKDKVIEYLDPASTDGGRLTREEALFTNQKLGQISSLPRGAAFESPVAEDTDYADGRVAAETMERLRQAKDRGQADGTPFFIAAGFVRPHLPFSVPKRYWDLYDRATLPMPVFEDLPEGAPQVAGKRGGEIAAYEPVPTQGDFPEDLKRSLIHGYYASTSYVDAQVGKVLAELDRLEVTQNTIIVLWGDHGFHLGDLGIWTKHTNYEQANRIPLLIAAAGVTPAGSVSRQLAETVDIFPTLAELCGLPAPLGPQAIDGISLVPVLRDPQAMLPRDHAYHVFPRRQSLGRAIRTDRYRLVQWKGVNEPEESAQYELYDYQTDPLETQNLAASAAVILDEMKAKLAAYPAPVPLDRPLRPATRPAGTQSRRPAPSDASQITDAMSAEQIRTGLASHDQALFIKSGWIRDPYITRAPDGYYYLTGTTPNPADRREENDPYNTPPLPRKGIQTRDLSETAQTINQQGVTIVPLEVRRLDDGDVFIRAKDPDFATVGPDEAQSF